MKKVTLISCIISLLSFYQVTNAQEVTIKKINEKTLRIKNNEDTAVSIIAEIWLNEVFKKHIHIEIEKKEKIRVNISDYNDCFSFIWEERLDASIDRIKAHYYKKGADLPEEDYDGVHYLSRSISDKNQSIWRIFIQE